MNSQICCQSGTAPPRAQVLKSTPPRIPPTQRRHLLFVLGLFLIVAQHPNAHVRVSVLAKSAYGPERRVSIGWLLRHCCRS